MNRSRTAAILFSAAMPAVLAAQVTRNDVTSVDWKITAMRPYFSAVWQDFFLNVQARLYTSPKIVAVNGRTNSACGVLDADNAGYCSKDNTIYYDRQFLADEMKAAASALGSDGDYAPVVIFAHEWGHAAAYWYGREHPRLSWQTFAGEQLADCLAGAVTRSAERDGKLARGDLEEAEFAVQKAGTKIAGNAPKGPIDRAAADLIKYQGHGEPADRLRAFRKGYRESASGCLADLKLGGY